MSEVWYNFQSVVAAGAVLAVLALGTCYFFGGHGE